MSLACVNIKNFNLSSKMDEDVAAITTIVTPSTVKQGIVSILGSDTDRSKAASIRRTLSADMSSKKWLAQNGMLKKIASSDHFPSLVEEDELNRPAQDDVWSSIITQQKNDSSNNLPTPYIHPLVKKSAGSLSEKSLQICTESLGSETGSDGFSSHSPSENGDVDEDKDNNDQQQQQQQQYNAQSFEEVPVVKYNYSKRSSFPRSFPPPLPSLDREDKTAVHVQSRRQNGRLILEAVSVPPQNHFRAQRHDGRLLLTLIDTSPASAQPELMEDHQVAEFERVFDDIEEIEHNGTPHLDYDNNDGFDGEEEEEEDDDNDEDDDDDEEAEQEEKENGTHGIGIVMNHQNPKLTNVNTSVLMMKQIIGLEKNKNHQTWSNKFNKAVKLMELEDELTTPLPQSLPPPHRVSQLITPPPQQPSAAAAASFNPYEYFWRKKPTVASIVNNPTSLGHFNKHLPGMNNNNNNNNSTTVNANSTTKTAPNNDQQDMVLMRGNKANMNYYLVKGCKEARRTLLIWEPQYIATS